MGNEVSTVGGAIATAATSVAAGVTLGQVEALNNAVKDCAQYTANHAQETTVRHIGETAVHAAATAGTAVAAGVTFGQVEVLNKSVEHCAANTAKSAVMSGAGLVQIADEVSDGVPGIAHVKGGILYAVGQNERADRAVKGGSRTLGTIAGGAAGFMVGGPAGAVAGGIAGGAAMDGIITGIDSAVHADFRPSGQIAAWNAVAQVKSADEVIGGVIGGVFTPLMDGFVGLGAGKAYGKWRLSKDLKTLEAFMDGEQGAIGMDEAFEAMERISKNKTPGVKYAEVASIEEAAYEGRPIPREAVADEHITVYRGDRSLLKGEDMIQDAFKNGVPPRGPLNDAFQHAQGNKHCNYVSTSKNFGVARRFGKQNRRHPQFFGVMKVKPRRGIDLKIAADMLERLNPFPEQAEVAIFEGIHPHDIEGVLVRNIDGFTWHANPDYIAPAPPALVANPNSLAFIGAILVINEELFHAAIMGNNSQHHL